MDLDAADDGRHRERLPDALASETTTIGLITADGDVVAGHRRNVVGICLGLFANTDRYVGSTLHRLWRAIDSKFSSLSPHTAAWYACTDDRRRDISDTHLAMATTRMQKTMCSFRAKRLVLELDAAGHDFRRHIFCSGSSLSGWTKPSTYGGRNDDRHGLGNGNQRWTLPPVLLIQ